MPEVPTKVRSQGRRERGAPSRAGAREAVRGALAKPSTDRPGAMTSAAGFVGHGYVDVIQLTCLFDDHVELTFVLHDVALVHGIGVLAVEMLLNQREESSLLFLDVVFDPQE